MRAALVVLGVCVAVGVGGCGGGSDDASISSTGEATTSASQPSTQNTTPTAQGEEKSQQGQGSTKQGNGKSNDSGSKQGSKDDSSSPSSKGAPHRTKVPAISSAPIAGSRKPAPGVKTVPGADNSVQEYGVESGSSERREAAIALKAYLNARADEDWGVACSLLAKKPMEQLERLQAAAAKQGKKLDGCPPTMALLREGEAQTEEQATITEVLSFRGGGDISGDPSYLIYVAPPGRTFFSMPMYFEGGTWKVGLARAAELPVG